LYKVQRQRDFSRSHSIVGFSLMLFEQAYVRLIRQLCVYSCI
jgi:hypothetical protein